MAVDMKRIKVIDEERRVKRKSWKGGAWTLYLNSLTNPYIEIA